LQINSPAVRLITGEHTYAIDFVYVTYFCIIFQPFFIGFQRMSLCPERIEKTLHIVFVFFIREGLYGTSFLKIGNGIEEINKMHE
jgi:hypothetical protein